MQVTNNDSKKATTTNVAGDAKLWSCNPLVRKIFHTFILIIWAYIIVFLGTMIRNNIRAYDYIGQADKTERTLALEARGKVVTRPDIAATTIGMTSSGETVGQAQEANTKVMNNLISKLKALGVEDKDIKTTNYNIYPQYDYLENEGRVLKGYDVNQNVTIKIRDLDKVNAVIALAGEVGANNVGGLEFTIDDMEVYLTEARRDAMDKIIAKMNNLRDLIGIKFVDVVSYNEYSGGSGPYPIYETKALDYGIGGAAPVIESGSTDVILNVSIVFEIK